MVSNESSVWLSFFPSSLSYSDTSSITSFIVGLICLSVEMFDTFISTILLSHS
jgi:hypothetical protein